MQPIENRAAQHYPGQQSSSHRGTETDAYASARHDYDAAQCPAIFTGLQPSKLDTGSLTAACHFKFIGAMCSVLLASFCKATRLCVHLLSGGGGQLAEQQSEEVTFSLSVRNPLLSYCAGSPFLGTSGNVFLLTRGGEKGLRTPDLGRRRRGCKKSTTLVKSFPLHCSKHVNFSMENRQTRGEHQENFKYCENNILKHLLRHMTSSTGC